MSGGRVTPTAAPVVVVLDLPTRDGVDAHQPWVAAAAVPWPGPMVVHRRRSGSFEAVVTLDRPAVIGSLATALPAGRVWQVDDVSTVEVELVRGAPSSVDDEALLAGANLAAIGSMADGWEVVQFGRAELVATRRYRLSRLLRGQGGTEARAAVATA
ncbi:phage tail baseplate protein, partial [Oharaeibacter diazotrophicus]|uniref:GTA baseplate fiber-binding domain-containing protein n=1 Tax=Oharaeibacter diazotrophicus TaxID=1920512 RepID=UPI003CCEA2DA